MASRFTSVTQEQILSINEAAVPKYTKMASMFGLTLLCLTFFDQLTYHVTLCAQKSITQRDFHFLLCAFIEVLEIHQILEWLIIQLCVVYTCTKTIIHFSVGESGGWILILPTLC